MSSITTSTTKYLRLSEGKIAYDDTLGQGRVIVCVPGMGDLRQSNRFLVPLLRDEGYRVITMDVRGHGESSITFTDFRASAIGKDIVALLDHLNISNAIVLGSSMAGGSAVWAAANRPERISTIILSGSFVRDVPISVFMQTTLNVLLWRPWGAILWHSFYKTLFKANPPSDLDAYAATVSNNLKERGRLEALQKMMKASKADCEAEISKVRATTLVLMGTQDPDFPKPAEEAQYIAKALNAKMQMVEGAGHYPHVEHPELVIQALRELF